MRLALIALLLVGCGEPESPPCECPHAATWFPVTDKWADQTTYTAWRCYCRPMLSIEQQPMDTNPQLTCEQNAQVFGYVCTNQGLPLPP